MTQYFLIEALAVSATSGLFTSSWGAFKDGPYEGFRPRTFPRSILLSLGFLLILLYRGIAQSLSLWHIFFLVMGLERAMSEIYKACFRLDHDVRLFLIPQRLNVLGRNVKSELARFSVGIVLTAWLLWGVGVRFQIQSLSSFIFVAAATGLGISAGGAWKDAPFEGFQWLKFFRSSIVLAAIAPLVWHLGPLPLGVLVFLFGGVERLLVEYCKSYLFSSVPGKFHGNLPIVEGRFLAHRHWLRLCGTALVIGVVLLYFVTK